MSWKKFALARLKESGLRLTPQRIYIIEVIGELGPSHPTLKMIFEEVRSKFPTISFSTLYSNILTMRDLGLLEIFQVHGETRIEINTDPHLNLIDDEIRDLEDPRILEEIERLTGRKVRLVNVYLETNKTSKGFPRGQ